MNQFTPSAELMQGTYTLSVQAMNASGDWSNSGTSTVNVQSTVTSVVTTPSAISVQKGNTEQFSATVLGTGGPAQTVNWQVIGGGSGTHITSGGALTVAANETASTLTVTATSIQDTSKLGTATVTVTEPKSVTYAFTLSAETGGSITSGQSGLYPPGTQIEIAATPASNYSFVRWVSSGGGIFQNMASASTIFIMPENATTIKGQFALNGNNVGGSDDSDRKPQKNKEEKASDPSSATSTTLPTYSATANSGNGTISLAMTIDAPKGTATLNLDAQQGRILAQGGKMVVSVPAISGIMSYTLGVPKDYLNIPKGTSQLIFATQYGIVALPSNMLVGLTDVEGQQAELTISQGNKTKLTKAATDAIGERPLADFEVKIDGKEVKWNNPNAPVEVSLPYIPKEEELKKAENLVIWYIDDQGHTVAVPSGKYDQHLQAVSFKTTHFSQYGIGFNSGTFKDVPENAWYKKAVDFIGAREIALGSDDGLFNPQERLTRGEFLVMLMKAYGISPTANSTENFSDAGNTYYTAYLGAAKTLGIARGNGNNRFAPDQGITRQEVFVMLYNLLKAGEQLPEVTSEKTVLDFSDAKELDSWAVEAIDSLIHKGIISGNNGKLSPREVATRAQMAQLLYNLLSK